MLHLRVGAACFAVLDGASVRLYESVCKQRLQAFRARARACLGTAVPSRPYHELGKCSRTGAQSRFQSARACIKRECRLHSGSST